jgi:HEAT repeat protein
MKKLILEIIICVCIILLGVWLYLSSISEDSEETGQDKQFETAEVKNRKPSEPLSKKSGNIEKDLDGKEDKNRDSSASSLKGDVSTAVRSFSDIVSEGGLSQKELIQEIKGLKEKDKEGVTELENIIEGDSTSFFKLIAAGVLGGIYLDTHDPIVKTAIEYQVLPLIQEILDTSYDMNLKRQAVYTLGELDLQSAQDRLIDVLLDDTHPKLQLTSMLILREKGSSETASQLLDMLQFSPDIVQVRMAAAILCKMNNQMNDPKVYDAIQALVPELKEIIEDESQVFKNRRNAFMVLGSLGTPESIESVIKVMEERLDKDSWLEQTAFWSMVYDGNRETAERLGVSLSKSDNDNARILFASIIGGIANWHQDPVAQDIAQSLALPILKDLCQTVENSGIQIKAIYAMGVVGNNQDIEFLQEIGKDNKSLSPFVYRSIYRIKIRESGQGEPELRMIRIMKRGY